MLRVILVDDEPLARQALRQLCAGVPEIAVVGEADRVALARELVGRERPDAVFLDIEMPGGWGFDLVDGLDPAPRFVVVTGHTEHAVRAFEFEAVDFLLKPVRPERFAQAVRRLGAEGDPAEPLARADRICLRTPGRTVVATLDRVVALGADGDFTRVHLASGPPLLICQRLGAYEASLPSPPFARLDRSLIINLDALTQAHQDSRDEGKIWLEGIAEPFVLGRTAQTRLRAALAAVGGR